MFETNQQAGSFAQSLREILRKMSRDESHIQVKVRIRRLTLSSMIYDRFLQSLEEILKLGYDIVNRETSKQVESTNVPLRSSRKSPPRQSSSPTQRNNQAKTQSRKVRTPSPKAKSKKTPIDVREYKIDIP
jgi:hypothetical protein